MKEQFSDTDIDLSLKELDSHVKWKKKQLVKNRILSEINSLHYEGNTDNRLGSFKKRIAYTGIAATLFIGLFAGSPYYTPVLAEVISKIPKFSHNSIQLQKHHDEIKAYLNLISAYNKGNKEAYLQTFSKNLSNQEIQKLESDFNVGVQEKHQFTSEMHFIESNESKGVLLSNETHAIHGEVKYNLNVYIIITKEDNHWKVLEMYPFKKTGRGMYGSSDDFDHTNEVIHHIEKTYDVRVDQ